MATAAKAVDTDFITRAVEQADLNAVRVALYQNSGDAEVGALPPTAQMSDAQKAMLIDRAVAWLADNAASIRLPEPPEPELRKLMTMVTGKEMSDHEFAARRDLPAFRDYPFAAEWEGDKPAIPEDFSVIIVGSGPAGIAASMQCKLLGVPYTVLERQDQAGGTWTINRYPDVRVDTPSVNYEFGFEKDYRWAEHFNRGGAVREYLQHISEKYGIADNTLFGHDVKRAEFDPARDMWVLTVDTPAGEKVMESRFVITACGTFANAQLPNVKGVEKFRGAFVHPSKWPADLDLRGKRVAVIGNGSTGVQLLSAVAQQAAHVTVIQRTAQWISPREKYGEPIQSELAWLIDSLPGYWNWSRYLAAAGLFDFHLMQRVDRAWQEKGGKVSEANDQVRDFLISYIRSETNGDEELINKLIPDYAPLSRRPVVDNGWYRALTRDNVDLIAGAVERFDETGFTVSDGTYVEVDVVVSATGFDVLKYLWPARYKGADGQDLHDSWDEGDGPRAYISMMVPRFPNMFMLYGPNSQPLTGGTGLPQWWTVWSSYAGRVIMQMIRDGKTRVDVKPEAFDRFNRALDAEGEKWLQMTPEGGMDKNYYVNQKARRLGVSCPFLSPDFHRMCTVVEWDDLALS
ncbi:4-hydroxyacetophenone monooxygenase [Sphingobium sp. OAS761]|uniref:flavin-containing monooxygenase n=1 Tax=Sphingobium sp. OAS761 TaxID=2817901 RepID=UPI00209FB378|nr:NAD(P)/FAD-dependent oxidoreductase [Sphingobium sp. OAS761]MCP1470321.1 4-hydroxyacetophenone monooxygenase [Sphingobium sp. OAS761]